MDVYLTYYKTEVINGKNFYYLRAVFLPTDFTGTILLYILKVIGTDITHLFNISTAAPSIIPEGTTVYNINGSAWTAPTDLFLVCSTDYPVVKGDVSGGWDVEDLLSNQSFLVYAEVKPYTLGYADLPSEFQANGQTAISSGVQEFLPSTLSEQQVASATRRNDYPFWTTTQFEYWYVYDGCEYDPEATPDYNLHVTLTMEKTWYVQFVSAGAFEGKVYWKHDGHRYKIDSCNEEMFGEPIWVEGSTVTGNYTYVHLAEQPQQWFSPLFVFGRILGGGSSASLSAFASLFNISLPVFAPADLKRR